MHRALIVAVLLGVVVALSGCGNAIPVGPAGAVGVDGPITQEQPIGAVTVIATFDPAVPDSIELAFDTHSVDLAFDVDAAIELTFDGRRVERAYWDGAPPGGHHRYGTIWLPEIPRGGQTVALRFTGLGDPVTFTWRVPG